LKSGCPSSANDSGSCTEPSDLNRPLLRYFDVSASSDVDLKNRASTEASAQEQGELSALLGRTDTEQQIWIASRI
jgi:hypothetical protein